MPDSVSKPLQVPPSRLFDQGTRCEINEETMNDTLSSQFVDVQTTDIDVPGVVNRFENSTLQGAEWDLWTGVSGNVIFSAGLDNSADLQREAEAEAQERLHEALMGISLVAREEDWDEDSLLSEGEEGDDDICECLAYFRISLLIYFN